MAQLHGSKWTEIGAKIGRMPQLCRDRWRKICCESKAGRWDETECDKLTALVHRQLSMKAAATAAAAAASLEDAQSDDVVGDGPKDSDEVKEPVVDGRSIRDDVNWDEVRTG